MAVDAITGATNSGTYENPNATLDKEAFLKLFLTELQQQDPTAPMESEKMLEQSAMLAEMETNEMLKEFVEELSDTMMQSATLSLQYSAVGMVGKKVETDLDSLTIDDVSEGNANFQLYFDEPIKSGEVSIYDSNGEIVNTISLSSYAGQEGFIDFDWNLKNINGETVPPDSYLIKADYFNENEEKLTTKLGRGEVQSVMFDEGATYLKLGESYFPTSHVSEYYE